MDPKVEPLTAHTDLSGLAVHDADDLLAGHVFGVLTEADTGLLRFLDVEIDGRERHVLVPVGHTRLEMGVTGPRIRLRAAKLEDLGDVPSFRNEGWPDHDEARELLAKLGRSFRGDRYYAHPAFDHRGLYAGEHPIVAVESPRELVDDRLILLSDSNYKVASGESDVRGWPLRDAADAVAGQVIDLIADLDALKVRYAVVCDAAGHKHLLPIGYVEIDNDAGALVAPGLVARDVAALPLFEGLPLTRVDEDRLLVEIERALDARNPFLRVDFSDRQLLPEQRRT